MTSILANNDVDSVPEISDYVCTCLTAFDLHFSLNCTFEFSCGLWGGLIDPVFKVSPQGKNQVSLNSVSAVDTQYPFSMK